jgi:hypothetical protein
MTKRAAWERGELRRVASQRKNSDAMRSNTACPHNSVKRQEGNNIYCKCGKLVGFVRLPGKRSVLGD